MHYAIRLIDKDGDRYIHDTVFSSREKVEEWAKEFWSQAEKTYVRLWQKTETLPGCIYAVFNEEHKVVARIYPVIID